MLLSILSNFSSFNVISFEIHCLCIILEGTWPFLFSFPFNWHPSHAFFECHLSKRQRMYPVSRIRLSAAILESTPARAHSTNIFIVNAVLTNNLQKLPRVSLIENNQFLCNDS